MKISSWLRDCLRDSSQRQAEAFDRDGFVVVDKFFWPRDLDDFAEAFWRLREFESLGETYDACAQMPQFLRLVSYPRVAETANLLLDRPENAPLYCFTNRCRIDPPNDERRTYGWHQEVFYTIPHGRFVQTWAPLIHDTTVENGTIEVCVGSHKEGIARQTWTEPEGRASQIIVPYSTVSKYEQRAIPMKLGQIMFFNGHLIHKSGRNTSKKIRFSLVGMYHSLDAPGFRVPKLTFIYRGQTPREWYEENAPRMV